MLEAYDKVSAGAAVLRLDVQRGEAMAQALVQEAFDLVKMSAAVDPEMPILIGRMVDRFAELATYPPRQLRWGEVDGDRLQRLRAGGRAAAGTGHRLPQAVYQHRRGRH